MSLTKLSLVGNNLIIRCQGDLVSDISAGDGKIANLLCNCPCRKEFVSFKEDNTHPLRIQSCIYERLNTCHASLLVTNTAVGGGGEGTFFYQNYFFVGVSKVNDENNRIRIY